MASDQLNILDIIYSSSVDGTGFRDVLFVCGCPHHCPECHNPQSWNAENGHWESVDELYKKLTKSSLTNVTFSGGEPFEQTRVLCKLAKRLKEESGKTIWIYSGYRYEELKEDGEKKKLLSLCDVLVDGKYEKNNTELNMRFKGSLNQRIIDIPSSLKENKVVLFLP